MKVLVTGFEPFGDQRVNASWLAVSGLPQNVDKVDIVKVQLPCTYFRSVETLAEVVKEHPDISDIILVGEAGGRTRVSVEMIGVNIDDTPSSDNAGNVRRMARINPTGPDGHFSTLPVREIVDHLIDKSIPAEVSWTAGQFVCNHTLYSSLDRFPHLRVGFVHVPYTLAQAAPKGVAGQSVEELTRAVHEIIRFITSEEWVVT